MQVKKKNLKVIQYSCNIYRGAAKQQAPWVLSVGVSESEGSCLDALLPILSHMSLVL